MVNKQIKTPNFKPEFVQENIRNFCIIAHIDHGKSTLADRLLQATGAVSESDLQEQHLDSMAVERERGITVKAATARIIYSDGGQQFCLNLIDTPGHVDFNYEVIRSIAACEGALLVVDAAQGVQAQTVANTWLALERGLDIIPVVNKIDLPAAEPTRVSAEICSEFGFTQNDIVHVSAKTGAGLDILFKRVVAEIRPPVGDTDTVLRAMIFDSSYDSFRGVIANVRVVEGTLPSGAKLVTVGSRRECEAQSVGVLTPTPVTVPRLSAGEVGFVVTGLKSVKDLQVGDTLTLKSDPAKEALPSTRAQTPSVFAGIYPAGESTYVELREALDKLSLTDGSVTFEPESSAALGFGFRCGFLGALHMEVVSQRIEQEYSVDVIATAPSVEYEVLLTDGSKLQVGNPSKMPDPVYIREIREPWATVSVIAPSRYLGPVMEQMSARRGQLIDMDYLQLNKGKNSESGSFDRVSIRFEAPISELLTDFHDSLKAATSGYASMSYKVTDKRPEKLVKLDILVNHEPVDALSLITHKSKAEVKGRKLVTLLKGMIPRQMFEVPIQAAIGGHILARENIKALRKNVLAKCYGGDVTRKRKLLARQAAGKKKMKMIGSVEVPQEAFMAALKLDKN